RRCRVPPDARGCDPREAPRGRPRAPRAADAGARAPRVRPDGGRHMIAIERLRKCFGPLVAVDDLDVTIEPGTVFGFLGRNGAGRTTTIRMMMGLLEPTSATVRLGGHDIAREPEAAKRLTGYLPDRPHLYDKLTGLEYLGFVGELFGLSRREA